MTKIHEEFIRGKVESIKSLSENLKGELTVVLSEKIKEKNVKREINESVKIEIKEMLKNIVIKMLLSSFQKRKIYKKE